MGNLTRYNNPKDAQILANALQDLPENWLICRDMRHAWEVSQDFHVVKQTGTKVQHLRRTLSCLRCETLRNERYIISRYGVEKEGQSYTYPDQYQLEGIPRGVKPSSIVQAEQYRRAMEKVAASQRGLP